MKLGCDEGGVVALKSTSPKQEVEMTAAIIPRPAAVKTKRGAFELGVLTSIVADKTLLRQAQAAAHDLAAIGVDPRQTVPRRKRKNQIAITLHR
jgi:hypothetical protein